MSNIYLPTSSSWFRINSIHRIERESHPEYFSGSSDLNPQKYLYLRNKIISIFYKFSDRYLTATHCIQLIADNACNIMRIHHFLEHWGIINFYFDEKRKSLNCYGV